MSERLSRTTRTVADRFCRVLGTTEVCRRRVTKGITILAYHRILADEHPLCSYGLNLVMPASAFRQQVLLLARRCSVQTLGSFLKERGSTNAACHA